MSPNRMVLTAVWSVPGVSEVDCSTHFAQPDNTPGLSRRGMSVCRWGFFEGRLREFLDEVGMCLKEVDYWEETSLGTYCFVPKQCFGEVTYQVMSRAPEVQRAVVLEVEVEVPAVQREAESWQDRLVVTMGGWWVSLWEVCMWGWGDKRGLVSRKEMSYCHMLRGLR